MTPEQRQANQRRQAKIVSSTNPKEIPHVVWLASYGKMRARITLRQSLTGRVPSFIHEHGQEVRWKVLEGKQYLR